MLREGRMTLYVQDAAKADDRRLATSMRGVESFLDREVSEIHNYFPEDTLPMAYTASTKVENDGRISYDKSRLSYTVLKGIVFSKNMSSMMYSTILEETLRGDYNIPVTMEEYTCEAEHGAIMDMMTRITEDNKKAKEERKAALMTEWRDADPNALIIDTKTKTGIDMRIQRGDAVTDKERQDAWAYDVVHEIYKVDVSKVDADFMMRYVGTYEVKKSTNNGTLQSLFKYKRLDHYLGGTFEENRRKFQTKLREITANSEQDKNIKLYKAQMKRYYKTLLEGQYMLGHMFGGDRGVKEFLCKGKVIEMSEREFGNKFKEYVSTITDEHYKGLMSLFKMHRYFGDRSKLSGNKMRAFVKHVISEAFGMEMTTTRVKKKSRHEYHHGFSIADMLELKTLYGSEVVKFEGTKVAMEFIELSDDDAEDGV